MSYFYIFITTTSLLKLLQPYWEIEQAARKRHVSLNWIPDKSEIFCNIYKHYNFPHYPVYSLSQIDWYHQSPDHCYKILYLVFDRKENTYGPRSPMYKVQVLSSISCSSELYCDLLNESSQNKNCFKLIFTYLYPI